MISISRLRLRRNWGRRMGRSEHFALAFWGRALGRGTERLRSVALYGDMEDYVAFGRRPNGHSEHSKNESLQYLSNHGLQSNCSVP